MTPTGIHTGIAVIPSAEDMAQSLQAYLDHQKRKENTMQVVLNLDSATIGGTVEEMMKSLTEEDRRELAKQVMLEVLSKPQAAERRAYEAQVIQNLIAQYSKDSYNRITDESSARASYKFTEQMQKFKSTSDIMMEEITKTTVKFYKEMVDQLVKDDPQTQETVVKVREQFVADMPKLLQMTMATYFASQMNNIAGAMMAATGAQGSIAFLGQSMAGQLANQGIHVTPPSY